MSSENLAYNIVTMQQAYFIEELSNQTSEYISLHRVALQHFEKALIQQESHLYQRMPIVSACLMGVNLHIVLVEDFNQANASIWILDSGYAVVSEDGSSNRYYQFKSACKDEILSNNMQMNVLRDTEGRLDREIIMLKEKIALYKQSGVQAHLINDELVIRRLHRQIL